MLSFDEIDHIVTRNLDSLDPKIYEVKRDPRGQSILYTITYKQSGILLGRYRVAKRPDDVVDYGSIQGDSPQWDLVWESMLNRTLQRADGTMTEAMEEAYQRRQESYKELIHKAKNTISVKEQMRMLSEKYFNAFRAGVITPPDTYIFSQEADMMVWQYFKNLNDLGEGDIEKGFEISNKPALEKSDDPLKRALWEQAKKYTLSDDPIARALIGEMTNDDILSRRDALARELLNQPIIATPNQDAAQPMNTIADNEKVITLSNAIVKNVINVLEKSMLEIPRPAHTNSESGNTHEYFFTEPKIKLGGDEKNGRISIGYTYTKINPSGKVIINADSGSQIFEFKEQVVFECQQVQEGRENTVEVRGRFPVQYGSTAWVKVVFDAIWEKMSQAFNAQLTMTHVGEGEGEKPKKLIDRMRPPPLREIGRFNAEEVKDIFEGVTDGSIDPHAEAKKAGLEYVGGNMAVKINNREEFRKFVIQQIAINSTGVKAGAELDDLSLKELKHMAARFKAIRYGYIDSQTAQDGEGKLEALNRKIKDPTLERYWNILKDNPSITDRDLAQQMKVTRQTANKRRRTLEEMDFPVRVSRQKK